VSRHAPVVIAVCVVASLLLAVRVHRATATGEPHVTPEIRAATLSFAPEVAPGDRAWVLGAIATARPEAQRLIAEIDGMVEVKTDLNAPGSPYGPGSEQAIGLAEMTGGHAVVSFDVRELDGERAIDRNMVVLHELGHVVDWVLADDALVAQLDAGIPTAGQCMSASDGIGACTAIEERFADTFAKWALRGRFSLAGSGYGIPTPPSLEDWGMPLGRLAAELDVAARR
jgi:hypothetical protein